MRTRYDVFGIGSPLMDLLVEAKDHDLKQLGLTKGCFHSISEEDSQRLLSRIPPEAVTMCAGGSAANTLYGVAMLGGNVIFCGRVGSDSRGESYQQEMLAGGVNARLARSRGLTGQAITLVTPDGERTFAVHLGAALDLEEQDIVLEELQQSRILHVEGYLLEDRRLKKTALYAMQFAKEHGVRISIDLGDPGVVRRNKIAITEILEKYGDLVFANEEEAKELVGLDAREALQSIAELVEIAVIKVGTNGSYIRDRNGTYEIPSYEAKVIDTTGAGDLFAAGVLYGTCCEYNLAISGRIGSYFAARVVERLGARVARIDRAELQRLMAKGRSLPSSPDSAPR